MVPPDDTAGYMAWTRIYYPRISQGSTEYIASISQHILRGKPISNTHIVLYVINI